MEQDPIAIVQLQHDLLAEAGQWLLIEANGSVRVVSALLHVKMPEPVKRKRGFRHHEDRCVDVLKVLGDRVKTPDEIAKALHTENKLVSNWLRRLRDQGRTVQVSRGQWQQVPVNQSTPRPNGHA